MSYYAGLGSPHRAVAPVLRARLQPRRIGKHP
jgi:hypothetical protein